MPEGVTLGARADGPTLPSGLTPRGLWAGRSLETVAALLGHGSTKITERYYAHWVKGRQEKLEDEVKKSWAQMGTVADSASQKSTKSRKKRRNSDGGGGGSRNSDPH